MTKYSSKRSYVRYYNKYLQKSFVGRVELEPWSVKPCLTEWLHFTRAARRVSSTCLNQKQKTLGLVPKNLEENLFPFSYWQNSYFFQFIYF